ncbi:hypothetical protein J3A78_000025 [Streptomyces sp. PvR006]|uniref:hypothetical protein n=1 Tax=Streptomyces sp. PvR006 TaxID=2817860 RepID=UPI001AE1F770|nr:hypothetical protein [Streptomyces sp. PvR006]MBP2579547.1 hypothetical protein [Streptomyces sp. PvR006]
MTSIDLEITTDDPTEQAALFAYWMLAEDGESWVQTVAEIREQLGLTQQLMTRLVREGAEARLPEITCPGCGEPAIATSRTNVAELRRLGNALCASCKAIAQAEHAQQAAERVAARQRALVEVFPVHHFNTPDPQDMSLFTAVALHALFSDPAVEDEGRTTPTKIWPKDRPWAPTRLRVDYERRLLHADPSVMRAHHRSHPDAFEWEDDTPTGSIYLGDVSYYLLGAQSDLPARSVWVLRELNRIFREGPWPTAWHSQWKDLWDELAVAQASAYLDMKLNEHNLDMKQGEGTLTTLSDALATFSLGQVFNFIYRATKDSAAYYQRGGVNKRQAANSTIGRISAAADRARANGWDIKSFAMPWTLPMTAIGEVFFAKVMWQADMMHAIGREAHPPSHAWGTESAEVPEPRSERPDHPDYHPDDDINDCVECGRRMYGTGLCEPCQRL